VTDSSLYKYDGIVNKHDGEEGSIMVDLDTAAIIYVVNDLRWVTLTQGGFARIGWDWEERESMYH
jgi:hypothetical protein